MEFKGVLKKMRTEHLEIVQYYLEMYNDRIL